MPLIGKWAGQTPAPRPPLKIHYVLDRFGELTIIVLGEFFLKAAIGAAERETCALTTLYGLGLLGVSVGL